MSLWLIPSFARFPGQHDLDDSRNVNQWFWLLDDFPTYDKFQSQIYRSICFQLPFFLKSQADIDSAYVTFRGSTEETLSSDFRDRYVKQAHPSLLIASKLHARYVSSGTIWNEKPIYVFTPSNSCSEHAHGGVLVGAAGSVARASSTGAAITQSNSCLQESAQFVYTHTHKTSFPMIYLLLVTCPNRCNCFG